MVMLLNPPREMAASFSNCPTRASSAVFSASKRALRRYSLRINF
jgi:hypothetical protein